MNKPYLLVITGRPGAGKTTFAKELSNEFFMPVISRDQIKEGYVHTFGKRHTELPEEANKIATEIFFDTLMGLILNNVSVIAEAAFQHKVWSTRRTVHEKGADISIDLQVDDKVALDRFVAGLDNTLREYFHGDKGVDMARKGIELSVSPYDEPRLDVPNFILTLQANIDHPSRN